MSFAGSLCLITRVVVVFYHDSGQAAELSGFRVVAWRPVPVDESILGQASADTVPTIEQVVVAPLKGMGEGAKDLLDVDDLTPGENPDDEEGAFHALNSGPLERGLYLLRRRVRQAVRSLVMFSFFPTHYVTD